MRNADPTNQQPNKPKSSRHPSVFSIYLFLSLFVDSVFGAVGSAWPVDECVVSPLSEHKPPRVA